MKYPEISLAILDQKIDAIERADVQAVVKSPAFAGRVKQAALNPYATTSAELDAFIRAEIVKWEKVIREANIKTGG